MKVLLFLFSAALSLPVTAQDWPRLKPVHIVVGFAPGSTTDLVARLVQPKLQEALGQSVIVENKPGAGGNVATQQVKRSAPDGYALLVTSVAYAVNPSLYPNAGYDPFTDFIPVILGPSTPNIITVNPAVPAKNLQELIELARKQQLSYASSGIGTTTHLSMERIKMAAKIDITHVPYKGGGPAVTDLIGGQIGAVFATPASAGTHVKAGKIRGLAVTGATRTPALPDVPTIAESGYPGYEATNWYAYVASGKTPKDIVQRWNAELVKVLNAPDIRDQLHHHGFEPRPGTPEDLTKYMEREYATWGRVVKEAKITAN